MAQEKLKSLNDVIKGAQRGFDASRSLRHQITRTVEQFKHVDKKKRYFGFGVFIRNSYWSDPHNISFFPYSINSLSATCWLLDEQKDMFRSREFSSIYSLNYTSTYDPEKETPKFKLITEFRTNNRYQMEDYFQMVAQRRELNDDKHEIFPMALDCLDRTSPNILWGCR